MEPLRFASDSAITRHGDFSTLAGEQSKDLQSLDKNRDDRAVPARPLARAFDTVAKRSRSTLGGVYTLTASGAATCKWDAAGTRALTSLEGTQCSRRRLRQWLLRIAECVKPAPNTIIGVDPTTLYVHAIPCRAVCLMRADDIFARAAAALSMNCRHPNARKFDTCVLDGRPLSPTLAAGAPCSELKGTVAARRGQLVLETLFLPGATSPLHVRLPSATRACPMSGYATNNRRADNVAELAPALLTYRGRIDRVQ